MRLNNSLLIRSFSNRVVKYTGSNINVTPHNKDLRDDISKNKSYTFFNSFNMGYEGFSKPWKMPKMHPVVGNRGEFLFLALFFPITLLMKATREKNEKGIRNSLGTATNKYAYLATTKPSEF